MAILNKPQYWFQTKTFKIVLTVVGAVVVIALVVFSEQIGQLLDLFGSKAGISQETVPLNSTNFMTGSTMEPANSFRTDATTGRLMLNDPNGFLGQ